MDYKFKTEPYAHQLHALGASHNKENYACLWRWVQVNLKY
jgi:hypothetical protein